MKTRYEVIRWYIRRSELMDFIKSMIKRDPSWKKELKDHRQEIRRLNRMLDDIPHSVEEAAVKMNHNTACRFLCKNVPCSLMEAIWIYKYIKQGIVPWFMEEKKNH